VLSLGKRMRWEKDRKKERRWRDSEIDKLIILLEEEGKKIR